MQLIRQKQVLGNIVPNNANKRWLTRMRADNVAILINPTTLSLTAGDSGSFEVTVLNRGKAVINKLVEASTNNANVATGVSAYTNEFGKATIVVNANPESLGGQCNIFATYKGQQDFCRVSVTAP